MEKVSAIFFSTYVSPSGNIFSRMTVAPENYDLRVFYDWVVDTKTFLENKFIVKDLVLNSIKLIKE